MRVSRPVEFLTLVVRSLLRSTAAVAVGEQAEGGSDIRTIGNSP